MKDQVIEQAEVFLEKSKSLMTFLENKKAEVEKGVFSSNGDIRMSLSQEVGNRNVQIEVLNKQIKIQEASLQDAIRDLPRRDSERKKAEALRSKATEMTKDHKMLLEQASALLDEIGDLLAQAEAFEKSASMTPNMLKIREAEKVSA